jgi:hypothetical protein
VNAGNVLGVGERDLRRDHPAPIAALRAVARVAQPGHELDECVRDATGVPSALVGRTRERVARDRRAHDVERVLWVAAVRARIGEWADDVEELDNRSRPTVRDDQRERVGLG